MLFRSFLFFIFLLVSFLFFNPVLSETFPVSSDSKVNNDSSFYKLNDNAQKLKSTGYKVIIKYEHGFLAAGSEGRIDWISVSGKVVKSVKIPGEKFNCILSYNQKIFVAGENGSILISSDNGTFQKVNSGTDRNINSLCYFNGTIIAGTNEGEILSSNDNNSFHKIYLSVKGNIVSLSSIKSDCYGVTDKGEIIHTRDGVNWDIFDFNKVYADYYKPCSFTKIIANEQIIAVTGTENDGSPVLLFSTQGNVWGERTLNYTDSTGMIDFLTESPNDIFYDNTVDLFYLACNKGYVMQIPSCSHCNKLVQVSTENLYGISGFNNSLLVVGDSFCIKNVNQ